MSSNRTTTATSRLARPLAWACLLLLVAAAVPAAGQSQSDTVHVNPGEHAAVQIDFRDGPTKDVSYDVTVQEGPNIDVLVLDNANYQKYTEGEPFDHVERWSDLDTGNTVNEFRLEQHGTWGLVLDHTDEPEDGISPATLGGESVTARYSLEATTNVTDEARDTFDRLPAAGAGRGARRRPGRDRGPARGTRKLGRRVGSGRTRRTTARRRAIVQVRSRPREGLGRLGYRGASRRRRERLRGRAGGGGRSARPVARAVS